MKKVIQFCNEKLDLNIDYPKNDNEFFKLYNFLKGVFNYELQQLLKEVELPTPNNLTEEAYRLQDKSKVVIVSSDTSYEELESLINCGYTILYDTGEYLTTN